ncbi:MAG: hypothetical protein HY815_21785, partial [Candidatus Riflebacteria bacterium]|nr:hypothetical protein [Candidatus Riflebacteria bacterium]
HLGECLDHLALVGPGPDGWAPEPGWLPDPRLGTVVVIHRRGVVPAWASRTEKRLLPVGPEPDRETEEVPAS